MSRVEKQAEIARLRAQIATLEQRPALAENAVQGAAETEEGFLAAVPGLVQEVFVDEVRHAGAALGFALGQARALMSGDRPVTVYLQLAAEGQETGLPFGPGLKRFGIHPGALLLVRPADMADLLWSAEEALGCGAVAAVIADVGRPSTKLDFTASRRLSLRSGVSGGSMIFLHYGRWRQASAAQIRWHLVPAASARVPFDRRAPGHPRWQVTLEKHFLEKQDRQWLLEWTDNGFKSIAGLAASRHPSAGRAALSHAQPAGLADRFSQTA